MTTQPRIRIASRSHADATRSRQKSGRMPMLFGSVGRWDGRPLRNESGIPIPSGAWHSYRQHRSPSPDRTRRLHHWKPSSSAISTLTNQNSSEPIKDTSGITRELFILDAAPQPESGSDHPRPSGQSPPTAPERLPSSLETRKWSSSRE